MTQQEYRDLKKDDRLTEWRCSLCELTSSNDEAAGGTSPIVSESLDILENLADNITPHKTNAETTAQSKTMALSKTTAQS